MVGKKGRGASQGQSPSASPKNSVEPRSTNVKVDHETKVSTIISKDKARAPRKPKGTVPLSAKTEQIPNRPSESIVASNVQHVSVPDARPNIEDVIKVPITKKRRPKNRQNDVKPGEVDSLKPTVPTSVQKTETTVLANADINKTTISAPKRKASNKSPISPVWLNQKKAEFEKMVNDSTQSPITEPKSTSNKAKRRKSKAQPMSATATIAEADVLSSIPVPERKVSIDSPISSVWLAKKKEVFDKMINDCNQSAKPPSKSTNRNTKRRNPKPQVTPPTASIAEEKVVLQSNKSALPSVWLARKTEVFSQMINDMELAAKMAKSTSKKEDAPKTKPEIPVAVAQLIKEEAVIQQDTQDLPFVSPNILWRMHRKQNAKKPERVDWMREVGSEVMKWQDKQKVANVDSEGSSKKSRKRKGPKTATAESSNTGSSNAKAELGTLHKLPKELRDQIFEYALVQDKPIHVDALFRSLLQKRERQWRCGIVYTCRHFYEEYRKLYYSVNTFTVSLAAFKTLESTMKTWPRVSNAAFNLTPALANVRKVVIVKLGPDERATSEHVVWRALPQFLMGFKQLEKVELDFRGSEAGGIDWNTEKEMDYLLQPPSYSVKLYLNSCGVRFGWTKKEKLESGRQDIKEGALMVRSGRSQTDRSLFIANEEVVAGLMRFKATITN